MRQVVSIVSGSATSRMSRSEAAFRNGTSSEFST